MKRIGFGSRGATALALLLAAGIAVAAPALAHEGKRGGGGMDQRGGDRGAMLFERFDSDGDGRVTRDEVAAARTARQAALDADGDGFVSRDEMTAHAQAEASARAASRAGRMFDRLDADGDGRLGAAEVMTGQMGNGMQMFDRLDADGDGVITRDEAAVRGNGMRDRMERRGDGMGRDRMEHRDGMRGGDGYGQRRD